VYKIAIVGASSLLGRELKDVLAESPLAAGNIVLLDEDDAQGQLDQIGDEVAFIQALRADAFEHTDFTFFCGSQMLTLRHWRQAQQAGSTVLDLTGALDREPGVLIRAPWLGRETAAVDLFTPAIVPADPAVIPIALLLDRLSQAAPIRLAAATILEPASEFGRAAMDELHQQTISLLNFQPLPRSVYDAQTAYNMLCGMGEASAVNLALVEDRIRRHYEALTGGRGPALTVQVIHAPVFHGHTFSIAVEFERPVEIPSLDGLLNSEHLDVVVEDTDSPSNLAATGQDDILVRLRVEPMARNSYNTQRLWLWAAADNLRVHAQNAVQCALELRRLRPQGTVQ
jgi:aspartate-semialdehyde dehydrogenase